MSHAIQGFRNAYRLDEVIGQSAVGGDDQSLSKSVNNAMSVIHKGDGYLVHRRDGDAVRFSTDGYREYSKDVLLLSSQPKKWSQYRIRDAASLMVGNTSVFRMPMVALKYSTVDSTVGSGCVYIDYIQTLRNPKAKNTFKLQDYQKLKETVSVRPHEFLMAQFLGRLAPVLHEFPSTEVEYKGHLGASITVLRDRFLDKEFHLNAQRIRVQQILGEGNAWLQRRMT